MRFNLKNPTAGDKSVLDLVKNINQLKNFSLVQRSEGFIMNGKIRSLSVDEWFLSLQLSKIKENFHLPSSIFHLPFFIEEDISWFEKKHGHKKKLPTLPF
jgi:hypothetical protein